MLQPGQQISDYIVVGVIGEGGMATVYKVRHAVLGSEHALKVLHPSLVRIPEARERFLAEGRIQARIKHPNIVEVINIISEPAGLVMTYLDGPSLGERISAQGGPLPLAEIGDIMGDLLEGVRVVHEAGIVHRDLKPDNIKLQRDADGSWRPVLFDFGVARLSGMAEELVGHVRRLRTQAGKRMGTPGYMSPEQIHSATDIDARTDVFSLGCILYELLSGQQAFSGTEPRAIMERIVDGEIADLQALAPGAPPAVVAVARKAMQRDRRSRYTDAGEMLRALRAALAPPPPPPPRRPRRSYDLIALGFFSMLFAAAAGSAPPLLLRAQKRSADAAASAAMQQLAYIRTDRGASQDPARAANALDRTTDARQIRDTPATLGAAALATVWSQGWDRGLSTAATEAQLPSVDALTREAAEAGTGEGLLARALVAAAGCTRLPGDDSRRAAYCAEAPKRFEAAGNVLSGDARAWLRFEVWWSAAAHHNRVAAGWWGAHDAAQARHAWKTTTAYCQLARTDISAAPLHDVALARQCIRAASGLGRYGDYFRWARWLRDHDDSEGGLSADTTAWIYRAAHPGCADLAARAEAPWQPAAGDHRQRFCQHAGLLALGCTTQAEQIKNRYLRATPDPLLDALRDAYQPSARRCYLE